MENRKPIIIRTLKNKLTKARENNVNEIFMTLDIATEILYLLNCSVSQRVVNQISWERDTALQQLGDIGKGLGAKMDDVERIVKCKDCIHGRICNNPILGTIVDCNGTIHGLNWFCADGEILK